MTFLEVEALHSDIPDGIRTAVLALVIYIISILADSASYSQGIDRSPYQSAASHQLSFSLPLIADLLVRGLRLQILQILQSPSLLLSSEPRYFAVIE